MGADVYEPALEESIGSRKDGGFLPGFHFSRQVKATARGGENRRDAPHRSNRQLFRISRGCLLLPPLGDETYDQCDQEHCAAHDNDSTKSDWWLGRLVRLSCLCLTVGRQEFEGTRMT